MQHTLATLLSWLATYLIHSTLLLGGALVIARAVRSLAVREVLWKGALLGGLLTATLHGTLGPRLGVGRFDLPLVQPTGQATIGLQLGGEALPADELGESGPHTPAHARAGFPLTSSAAGSAAVEAVRPARWPALVAAAWALGVLVLLTVFLHKRRRMNRLFHARRPVRERGPRKALAKLLTQARSSRHVRLTSCPGIGSPVALGSSEICLPERAGRDLSMGELEALMAHELAHLERRDSAWLTAFHVLERVLFPQPLNRVVRRRLQSDVEVLCDDSAASRLGEPADLARCLARVAGWMEGSPTSALATGMAHAPSQLVARVERLLAPRPRARRGAGVLAALGVGLVLTAVGLGGPGVAAPPAPAKQDTPAQARLLRVVASMRTVAERSVPHYRLGEFETTVLSNLGRHLSLLHTRYPEASIAIDPHVSAKVLTGLVDTIFERFDAILVEGEGPENEALRAQIVQQRPVKVRLSVVRSGRRVDIVTGQPWSGEGRYTYDDTRLIEYRLGTRRVHVLKEVQVILRAEYARRPEARVRLDVGSGAVYADVVPAMDAVIAAGFTDIDFVGAYQDSSVSTVIDPEEEIFEEIEEIEEIEEEEPPEEIEEEPVLLDENVEEWSATLEVDAEGRIRADGELLRNPLESQESKDTKESWRELRAWLAMVAAGMEKVPAKTGPEGLSLPDEQLLIRADSQTTFRHVQKVMEFCGAHDVQIWKIELAAPDAGVEQVPIWLPTDPGVVGEQPPIPSVTVRVLKDATADGRLEYSIGPWKTTQLKALRSTLARLRPRSSDLRLVIDPRNGTTVMEVLHLLQMVRGEGYGPISFVGAYPEEVR